MAKVSGAVAKWLKENPTNGGPSDGEQMLEALIRIRLEDSLLELFKELEMARGDAQADKAGFERMFARNCQKSLDRFYNLRFTTFGR